MLEVIFAADGETVWTSVGFGDLQDTVAPVVGALWILCVIDGVVRNDEWWFEVWSRIAGAMTDKSVPAGNIESNK